MVSGIGVCRTERVARSRSVSKENECWAANGALAVAVANYSRDEIVVYGQET